MNNIEQALKRFAIEIKGKSKNELLSLRKTIMENELSGNSVTENGIIAIMKTAMIEEAIMKIDIPTGNIEVEYIDGTKEILKVW